jgi:predicted Zn-dependent peptidase
MKRHYGGEGMVLAAAGRVDHDELHRLAERAFADLAPQRARPEAKARYGGGEFREERDLEQVHVVLGFDGVSYHDPDHYAVSVFSTALGGGMSSRLFQEVREKRGLVYSIYSFGASYTDSGVFGIYAGTGEDEVEAMIPVICAELGKLKEDVGEAELARARAQLKAGTLMARESTSARLEQLAQSLLVYGRPIPVEEIVAEIEKVDRGRFVEVARRLAASPITMAALGPIDKVERASEVARRMM